MSIKHGADMNYKNVGYCRVDCRRALTGGTDLSADHTTVNMRHGRQEIHNDSNSQVLFWRVYSIRMPIRDPKL